jgi:hypothetical protein
MRPCSPPPAGNGAPTQRSMIEIAFRGTRGAAWRAMQRGAARAARTACSASSGTLS